MSQNDYTIGNQAFASFRADVNDALQALASNSSGPTAPTTTYANQTWYDTANDQMKIRNEANSGWITQYTIAATYLDIPDIRRNGSQVFSRDNIVGTVTQSGGVPTGAIVQRGSNGNGEFIRYADGTQICWDSGTTTNAISTADGTLYSLASSINRTFATAFLTGTIPAVIPGAGRTGGGSAVYATNDATPTDTGVNLMLTSPSNLTTSVTKRWNYTAFGRWF
jgi:hypothetical protein